MKIVTENKNDLLKRTELAILMQHKGNPGFAKVRTAVAEKYKVDETLVVVKEVQGNFGSDEFFIKSYIYKNEEDKKFVEPRVKPKKEAGK